MNKQIVILGAGESGVGAAILAQKQNYDVFVSDYGSIKQNYKDDLENNKIKYEENKHTAEKILLADEIIKSPGIPNNVDIIRQAEQKGIKIISEIEFASRYTDAKMICVTGSNGKTTTTLLTYNIFKNAGLKVGIAGNIGQSFARQVALYQYDYYILELSSFQLDNMYKFKADTAILLNITPDHLDRYNDNFEEYVKSKMRIIQNQGAKDFFVYNADDEAITTHIQGDIKSQAYKISTETAQEKGAFLNEDKLICKTSNNELTIMVQDISLIGKHNMYNSMAAAIAAGLNDITDPIIRKTLSSFETVEHRLEHFQSIRGIHFVNDSKATNVNSVWYAIEAIDTPIVLILGGTDKGNDYNILKNIVRKKVKAIVALGKDNSKIKTFFEKTVPVVDTNKIEDAVMTAYKLASTGETVLLSPACASFDLFDNYEDRGQKFKNAVRNL